MFHFLMLFKNSEVGVSQAFWLHLSDNLEKEISTASKFSSFLQSTFQNDYPKLLHLFHTFFSRITILNANQQTINPRNDWLLMKKGLHHLETAYLGRSLSKMFEPVNAGFPPNKPPTQASVNAILKFLASELELVGFDPNLQKAVAKNVSKSVSLFCVNTENLIVSDMNAYQISEQGNLTHSQISNIELCNTLYLLYDGVWKLIENKSNDVIEAIYDSLTNAQKLIASIVEPLLASMADYLESILLKVHQEDYAISHVASRMMDAPDMQCSPFLSEFRDKVQVLQNSFISAFNCGSERKDWISTLVSRLMIYFLRHVSIIRPLSEHGKLKLAADMAQFEFSLAPFFVGTGISLSDLTKPYKALRAFRPLLFLETSQVTATHHRAGLDLIFVLHHLFVRASPELQVPHSRVGWTPQQYVEWLDTHSTEEAHAFVIRCLDAYAADVHKRGGKQYTPEYPLLTKLLQPGNE